MITGGMYDLSLLSDEKPTKKKGAYIMHLSAAQNIEIEHNYSKFQYIEQDFGSTNELGPVYGYQWRFWPDGKGGHIDQIAALIDGLKKRPDSRRHLFHAWNVAYLPDETKKPWENAAEGRMALPPCHLLYQFYVANNKLSCLLYIRSNDLFLGNSYNTASVAFLTHMVAQQCGFEPGEVILSMGDLHLYKNHIEQAKLQLTREPRPLPKLVIKRKPDSIFDYKFEDFE
ncbi:thymidylate synthase, partial [bacterium]|nr:thymidylate synthase [bacterium]